MNTFLAKHKLLLIAAAVGLLVTVGLYTRTSLYDVPNLELSRSEIYTRAEAYAREQGFETTKFSPTILKVSSVGDLINPTAYLMEKLSFEDLRRTYRENKIPATAWQIVWTDPSKPKFGPQESMAVYVDFSGNLLGFERDFLDSAKIGNLPLDSAKTIAKNFIQHLHPEIIFEPETKGTVASIAKGYVFKSAKTEDKAGYTLHNFKWEKTDSAFAGTSFVMAVTVSGTTVSAFGGGLKIPQKYIDDYKNDATQQGIIRGLSLYLINFVMVIPFAIIFLKKYHEGEVGVRRAGVIFLMVLAIGTLFYLNILNQITNGSSIGILSRTASTIVIFMLVWITNLLIFALVAFFGWAVGESDARTDKTEHRIVAIDSLLNREFFTKEIGESIVSGLLFGLVCMGGMTLYAFICMQFFGAYPSEVGAENLNNTVIPFSRPIQLFFPFVINIAIRLCFLPRLTKRVKIEAVAIVITSIIIAFTSNAFDMFPFKLSFLGAVLLSTAISYFYLRFGLLAVMAAILMYEAPSLVPFLTAKSTTFVGVGLLDASVYAAVAAWGVVALQRGKKFEFKGSALPSHIERIGQRARMEQELEIARQVQLGLLPSKDPVVAGFDISGICVPALEVGGDYYDFIPLGQNKFGIAIGDVSGKGVSAAIYMTLTKGVIQSHAEAEISPKIVLTKVNSLICKMIKRGSFVSMIYAVMDLENRTLKYSRAGHNPLLMVGRETDMIAAPMPKGMALGLYDGTTFATTLEETFVTMKSGDTLVFYTDGFSEAKDTEGNEFGEEQLLASLKRHSTKVTSRDVINAIQKDVAKFVGLAPQHDDMTMVVVKVK
jgi:sigma-B regulation protein RsbU (phosphoserine phosphatase)